MSKKSESSACESQTGPIVIEERPIMDILGREFPEECVKKRRIMKSNGDIKMLDYIPGDKVIQRLNDVFKLNWSFEVADKHIDVEARQIAVLGRLTARVGSSLKIAEQWGGTFVSVNYEGRIISLGDDLKIATTDAMKKCATQLGVALYLYDENDVSEPVANVYHPTGENLDKLRNSVDTGEKNGDEEPPRLATPGQVEALKDVAKEEGVDLDEWLSASKYDSLESIPKQEIGALIVSGLKAASKAPEEK